MYPSTIFSPGQPTNFGLHESTKKRWIRELKAERMGHYTTDYSQAFTGHPAEAFPKRFASAPRYLSSHFNPISKVSHCCFLTLYMVLKCYPR